MGSKHCLASLVCGDPTHPSPTGQPIVQQPITQTIHPQSLSCPSLAVRVRRHRHRFARPPHPSPLRDFFFLDLGDQIEI